MSEQTKLLIINLAVSIAADACNEVDLKDQDARFESAWRNAVEPFLKGWVKYMTDEQLYI